MAITATNETQGARIELVRQERAAEAALADLMYPTIARAFVEAETRGLGHSIGGNNTDTVSYYRGAQEGGSSVRVNTAGFHLRGLINSLSRLSTLAFTDEQGETQRSIMYGGKLVVIGESGEFRSDAEKAPSLLATWQRVHADVGEPFVSLSGWSLERRLMPKRIPLIGRLAIDRWRNRVSFRDGLKRKSFL